ncbi:MAG: DUF1028 domain-containing protein [Chloroflexota bacterium]|nr:DUF1028 domain-containing protein [Chloroflexota bacterium]
MTYSIIARDPATGEMGCAVQSHFFSVGPVVPWAESGVGIVARQAMAQPLYGPASLDLMRRGIAAPDALRALLTVDPGAEQRQVAMIDASGAVAAHTSARCIAHAGHRTADGVSVQANMMERDTVPDAMLAAFTAETRPLAERLLAALDAAESEGGDIRGRQSAAMLIVRGTGTGQPWWVDRPVDLRVEDHPQPLVELRRLLVLRRAYDSHQAGSRLVMSRDRDAGMAQMDRARDLAPDNTEIMFWHALIVAHHDEAAARALIARACASEARWAELLRRLPAAGIFPDDPALIDRLLA